MRLKGGYGRLAAAFALAGLSSCAAPPKPTPGAIRINENPYPSTYQRYPGAVTVIRGARSLALTAMYRTRRFSGTR